MPKPHRPCIYCGDDGSDCKCPCHGPAAQAVELDRLVRAFEARNQLEEA